MKYDIFYVSAKSLYIKDEPLVIENAGYIEADKFNQDYFWELCNWSGWTDSKPINLFSKVSACSCNIAFYDPDKDEYYISIGFGWAIVKDFEKLTAHFEMLKERYNDMDICDY